ncbi:MAG: HD domain-containing phosphohydrolase [Caldimonas sp.]
MRAAAETLQPIDVQALRIGMFVHLGVGWMSHPFPLSSFKITSAQQVATIRGLGLQRVRWNPLQSDPAETSAPSGSAAVETHAPGDAGAAAMPAGAAADADRGDSVASVGSNDDAAARTEVAAAPAGGAAAASAAGTAVDADAPAPGADRAADTDGPAPNAAGAAVAAAPTASSAGSAGIAASVSASAAAAPPPAPAPAPAHERAARRLRLASQQAALRVCERQFGEATRACKQTADLVLMKPHEARTQAESLTKALLDKMLGEQEVCIRLLTEAAGDKASMHALNVMLVALLLGRSFGFAEADLLDLGVGAMLHDIGKIEMPYRLRHLDETFSTSEHRDYEEHVAHGLALARRMGLSAGATLVIAQHHEHADGSGFPLKLASDRMTVAARIVAIVNRYDNLCNPLFLAKALTPHEALSLLFAQGKSRYDTSILGAFIRMMGVYPPGSTVQLTDDRYAMVVSVNSTRPLKPNVLVHDVGVARDEAIVLDLEAADGLGIRRSIKPMQLPPASFEFLAPRQRVAYFFEPVERDE